MIDLTNVYICYGCSQDHYWDFLTGHHISHTEIPKGSIIQEANCCDAIAKYGKDSDDSWCESSGYDDYDSDGWKCSF